MAIKTYKHAFALAGAFILTASMAAAGSAEPLYVGTDPSGDASPPLPSFDIHNITISVEPGTLQVAIAFDQLSNDGQERYVPIALTGSNLRLYINCDIGRPNPAQEYSGRCAATVGPIEGELGDLDPSQGGESIPLPFEIWDSHLLVIDIKQYDDLIGDYFHVNEVYVGVQPEVGIMAGGDQPFAEIGVPSKPDEFLEETNFVIRADSEDLNKTTEPAVDSDSEERRTPTSLLLPTGCLAGILLLRRRDP